MSRPLTSHQHAALRTFAQRFGRPASLLVTAPGRINLIGEHTDYNDGLALPCAIDLATTIAAAPTHGNVSTIVADNLDLTWRGHLNAHKKPLDRSDQYAWMNYVLGAACLVPQAGQSLHAVDACISSTIPIGSGLSSSAALSTAAALLFQELAGTQHTRLDLAHLAQKVEHTFAGVPCGIMDMLTSLHAQQKHALLLDCEHATFEHIQLPEPGRWTLAIIDTGISHELASSEYAQRRATCAEVAGALDVPSLRHATMSMLDDALQAQRITSVAYGRAVHVVMENTRVLIAATALMRDDLAMVAQQMDASHDSLRDLYQVSCPELDILIETARAYREMSSQATISARMTGGGFGGCAIICAPAEHIYPVIERCCSDFENRFGCAPESAHVVQPSAAAEVHAL
ncbi:MAG: galactokinase [Phycisphaerales bacterium]